MTSNVGSSHRLCDHGAADLAGLLLLVRLDACEQILQTIQRTRSPPEVDLRGLLVVGRDDPSVMLDCAPMVVEPRECGAVVLVDDAGGLGAFEKLREASVVPGCEYLGFFSCSSIRSRTMSAR